MRVNNVLVRALSAVVVTVLLNGSVVLAFTQVAAVHGARVTSNASALA
jgi:hypothetical protein